MTSADLLMSKNIRPSIIRVLIFDYLREHRTHPTVEEIYTALSPIAPTLSKTTVYNTLRLFCQQGITKIITIEDQQARFDGCIEEHGHFLCKKCGGIFDFDLELPNQKGLQDFKVDTKDVYFTGECSNCRKNN